MRTRGAKISIALVCMVLGVMLAVQYKTTGHYKASLVQTQRTEDLGRMLENVTKEKNALNDKVSSLTEQLDNMRKNDQAMADLQRELLQTSLSAGLVELDGPGLIITVNDRPQNFQNGNPNEFLIHEADLLMLINELKASGAEAISLNDERITAMTEVRCAGPVILVNQNKIGTPFVLKAIGNPDVLESGMKLMGGIYSQLQFQGFQISLEKSTEINIPANNQQTKFIYALPKGKERV